MNAAPARGARGQLSVRAQAALLALIIAGALALRFTGLDWMLPHATEPDGIVLCTQVDLLERGDPEPWREHNYAFYPHLVARLATLGYVPAPPATPPTPASLGDHLARASRMHLSIRAVVAALSVLLVPATWAIARRFLTPGGALVAALLAATSVLDLWFADQARPHAAAAAFAALAVAAILRVRRVGRPSDYVLAGLAIGSAIGALQSGLAVLPPLAVALILRGPTARRTSLAWVIATLAIVALCLAAFYPFLFAPSVGRHPAPLGVEDGALQLSGHLIYFELFNGGGFQTVFETLAAYEPWISALAAIGLALGLYELGAHRGRIGRERLGDLAVVLAYALPYLLAIGLYQRTYQRFVIPLVPFLGCLAAFAVVRIAGVLARRSHAAATAIALALIAPQLVLALRLASLRTETDTVARAAEWVSANLTLRDRILVQPTIDLPLFAGENALAANERTMNNFSRPWYFYQRRLASADRPDPAFDLVSMPLSTEGLRESLENDPVGYLRGLDADWLVIEVYSGGRRPVVLNLIPPALPEIADRVLRIVPDEQDEGNDQPLSYQDDEYAEKDLWALRLLRARCFGPVIEIWRVRK